MSADNIILIYKFENKFHVIEASFSSYEYIENKEVDYLKQCPAFGTFHYSYDNVSQARAKAKEVSNRYHSSGGALEYGISDLTQEPPEKIGYKEQHKQNKAIKKYKKWKKFQIRKNNMKF